MAAAIVGPSGLVVGVDQAMPAITAARLRAEREHVTNVEFRHQALSSYAASERFDAAVGRYILLHQADPTSFIRDALRHVRPGGVLAFHDISVRRHDCFSHPVVPAWQEACDWITMAFDPEGPGRDAALGLVEHFIDAGLQTPALFAEALIGGGPDSPLYAWVAETLRSVAPVLVAKRLASQADLALLDAGVCVGDRLAGRPAPIVQIDRRQIGPHAELAARSIFVRGPPGWTSCANLAPSTCSRSGC